MNCPSRRPSVELDRLHHGVLEEQYRKGWCLVRPRPQDYRLNQGVTSVVIEKPSSVAMKNEDGERYVENLLPLCCSRRRCCWMLDAIALLREVSWKLRTRRVLTVLCGCSCESNLIEIPSTRLCKSVLYFLL